MQQIKNKQMKTIKLHSIGLAAIMMFAFSQATAQLVDFYSSPNYSNFINTMYSNSLLNSSLKKNTGQDKPGMNVSKSTSTVPSAPYVVPEYRRYPAVQFKSTGTRLTLQEYLDAVQISAADKAELKELILKIFKEWEAGAAAEGYYNDWALAYVSYVGLNSHVYYGKTEKLIIPFEQNVGLRDLVAEHATDNGLFNNVTDREKQELYELLILTGGLIYHLYEKACRENNAEEIKNLKLQAEQNLKLIGIHQQNNSSNKNPLNISRTITLNDYEFIAPEGWQVLNNKDYIQIQNLQSGCQIKILTPQPLSDDLENYAIAIFDVMYEGWQYLKSGEQQYALSRGYLANGLEYYMKEAGMSKLGADGSRYDGFEEGAAMIVKAGSQIVILSIRHNSSFMGHTDCIRKYKTMRRFFNSFTVKNVAIPKNEDNVAARIIGSWSMAESGASSEYVFAANSNYALIGALGSKYTTSDYRYEYLHIRTYAFDGDGSYSITGSQLSLKKRNYAPEQIQFRFEKVNRGGMGWKDRIWMLKKDSYGESEVFYEKKNQ
jgi:hypothetical protein